MQPNLDERGTLTGKLRDTATRMESATLPASVAPMLALHLTIQQLKVLTVLVSSPDGSTGRSLSALFAVSMPSMSGVLDRLVDQQVASRVDDPDDHRVRQVIATPLGRSIVQRLVAARPEFDDNVLAGLSLLELRALEHGMAAVGREMRSRTVTEEKGTAARVGDI